MDKEYIGVNVKADNFNSKKYLFLFSVENKLPL